MSAYNTDNILQFACEMLINIDDYTNDCRENMCSVLLLIENKINEANYDVLEQGVSSEEFELFFVAMLEKQGKYWKIDKMRKIIKEEEENDII